MRNWCRGWEKSCLLEDCSPLCKILHFPRDGLETESYLLDHHNRAKMPAATATWWKPRTLPSRQQTMSIETCCAVPEKCQSHDMLTMFGTKSRHVNHVRCQVMTC
eukprot:scaffold2352_cov153-Ochromonas_danica.AAC.21